jgi:hypothetical protein
MNQIFNYYVQLIQPICFDSLLGFYMLIQPKNYLWLFYIDQIHSLVIIQEFGIVTITLSMMYFFLYLSRDHHNDAPMRLASGIYLFKDFLLLLLMRQTYNILGLFLMSMNILIKVCEQIDFFSNGHFDVI